MSYEIREEGIQVETMQRCKVVLFLESHYETQPTKTANDLLPFFKEKGFKVLCLEDAFHRKEEALEKYKEFKKELSSEYCAYGLSNSYLTLEEAKKSCENLVSAFSAKINLIQSLADIDIQYCSTDTIRDFDVLEILSYDRGAHMAATIEKACDIGNVVALVSLGHYKSIQVKLMHDGFSDIRSYYMPNHPIPSQLDNYSAYERQLRSEESTCTEDNIVVIDLFKSSKINSSEVILHDYSNYLAGQNLCDWVE